MIVKTEMIGRAEPSAWLARDAGQLAVYAIKGVDGQAFLKRDFAPREKRSLVDRVAAALEGFRDTLTGTTQSKDEGKRRMRRIADAHGGTRAQAKPVVETGGQKELSDRYRHGEARLLANVHPHASFLSRISVPCPMRGGRVIASTGRVRSINKEASFIMEQPVSDAGPPAGPKKEGSVVAWRRRKDQRRPEILAAARALIEAQGASGVSIARIAAEAGVSEATVYNYFPGKQALVDEVLREWAMPFIEQLTTELRSIVELRSRLVLIATRFLRSTEQTPKLHRVYYSEIRWQDYRGSEIHRLNARFTQSFVETIKGGIEAGEIEPGTDPAMFRDMLFGGLEHIAQRTLLAGRSLNIEEAAARYVDLMLMGARPRAVGTDLANEIRRLAAVVDRLDNQPKTD